MSQYQCDSTTQRKVWFREGVVGELLESQLPLWTWSLTSVLTNIYVGPRKVRKIIFGICFLMLVLLVSYALMWVIIYNHLRRLFVGSTTSQRNRSKPNAAALQKAELEEEEEEENYDDDDEYEQLMTINNNRHFNNQLIKLENEKPNLLSSIPIPTLSEDYHQASSSSSLSISDSNEEILNGDEADDVPNLFQDAKNNTSCSAATNNFTQSHSSPSMMYSY
ncbi:E3 ubiquitin-protein ligase [Trichinella pseudospiralis]